MIKKISAQSDGSVMGSAETEMNAEIQYLSAAQRHTWRERLSRNLALSGLLILSIISVRNAELPSGETVLSSVQDIIQQEWDEGLGKISFVSNLFPESVAVFFEASEKEILITPCFGTLTHSWSRDEPYLGYTQDKDNCRIYAVASGEVMSIAHGNDEEKIIRIAQGNGIETLYYQLSSVLVEEGDPVDSSTCLGLGFKEQQVVIEVRQHGLPIDPSVWMEARNEAVL